MIPSRQRYIRGFLTCQLSPFRRSRSVKNKIKQKEAEWTFCPDCDVVRISAGRTGELIENMHRWAGDLVQVAALQENSLIPQIKHCSLCCCQEHKSHWKPVSPPPPSFRTDVYCKPYIPFSFTRLGFYLHWWNRSWMISAACHSAPPYIDPDPPRTGLWRWERTWQTI